ncbi:ABC transporter permease [Dactylosporangium sp. NPDC051485]|uniref:ABC transporter permease n=1 Tax=Dactylosporangium sp. NPDC051485 TaxID=3154846 RepID=UPI00341B96E8
MSTVHAIHAEWTKLRTVASTPWLLLAAVAVTVGISAAATAAAGSRACPDPAACLDDLARLGLTGAQYGQALVVVLAVLVIGEEYGTRSIGVSLAAVPGRWRLYLAKAVVLTGVVAAAGSLGVIGSLLAARHFLPGTALGAANPGQSLSPTAEPVLRAAYGTVLYLALVALLSYGVAAVLRDTAGAIATMLVLLYVAPILTSVVTDPRWLRRIDRIAPMSAGLKIQATTALDSLTSSPWQGLGVLGLWAAGALLAGLLALQFRDA